MHLCRKILTGSTVFSSTYLCRISEHDSVENSSVIGEREGTIPMTFLRSCYKYCFQKENFRKNDNNSKIIEGEIVLFFGFTRFYSEEYLGTYTSNIAHSKLVQHTFQKSGKFAQVFPKFEIRSYKLHYKEQVRAAQPTV